MRIEIENVINSSTPKLARNGLYLLNNFTGDRKLFFENAFINVLIDQCRNLLLQSLLLKCNNELSSL